MSRRGRRKYEEDYWDRMYGFFRCNNCGKTWESAHVYCLSGTTCVVFGQECRRCKTEEIPYHVQPLNCGGCGNPRDECICCCDGCGHPLDECTCCNDCHLPADECTCCLFCYRRQKDCWCCRACREEGRRRCRCCRNRFPYCECDAPSSDEKESDTSESEGGVLKRHNDDSKPHLRHLCLKCRAGYPCT